MAISREPWLFVPTKVTAPPSVITLANWNAHIGGNLNARMVPPSVQVRASLIQVIPPSQWVPVTWDTQNWDTDNMWSVSAADTITINTMGLYRVIGAVSFYVAAPGYARLVDIQHNGVSVATNYTRNIGITSHMPIQVAATLLCQDGDTIQLRCYQDAAEDVQLWDDRSTLPVRLSAVCVGVTENEHFVSG